MVTNTCTTFLLPGSPNDDGGKTRTCIHMYNYIIIVNDRLINPIVGVVSPNESNTFF